MRNCNENSLSKLKTHFTNFQVCAENCPKEETKSPDKCIHLQECILEKKKTNGSDHKVMIIEYISEKKFGKLMGRRSN